jgi:NAD(P)-dependent dehydrogenase (short-subunit alcohol dehydrogenase family)
MDIAREESIQQAFTKIKTTYQRLDVLINNAGICLKEERSLLQSELSSIRQTVETNAIAQLLVTRIFYPIIPAGGRIIMTSSEGGSMSDPVGGWSPAYCVSKSFLNAITRHLSYALRDRGIAVNAFDPGWVKTDMGGQSAPGSVEEGADTAVWLATREKSDTGKFYYGRKEIPW